MAPLGSHDGDDAGLHVTDARPGHGPVPGALGRLTSGSKLQRAAGAECGDDGLDQQCGGIVDDSHAGAECGSCQGVGVLSAGS